MLLLTLFLLSVLAVLCLVFLDYFVLRPYLQARYYRRQGVQGTPFTPLLGDLLRLRALRAQPFDTWFTHWETRYGRRVHYMFLGPEFRLRLCSPELARGVLVTHAASFHKGRLMRSLLGRALGDGLLLSEDEVHRRHRGMLSPAFHFARLQGMAGGIARASARAVRQLLQQGQAQPVDFHESVSALTLHIIGSAAFGCDFQGLLPAPQPGSEEAEPGGSAASAASATSAEDAASVYAGLTMLLEFVLSSVQSLSAFVPGILALPTPGNTKALAALERLKALVRRMIEARRQSRQQQQQQQQQQQTATDSSTSTSTSSQGDILLDFLLDAQDDSKGGKGFSNEEILGEALTFVLAGHETTAQALTWTLLLLAQNPAWKTRLREEVRGVLCQPAPSPQQQPAPSSPPLPQPRLPAAEDISSMPVLQAVLYESMRLYPPAPLVARECVRDGVVLEDGAGPGLRLCKGTTVIIPIASIHRDPELWRAPEAFDPGRWLLAGEGGGAPLRASGTANLRHPLAYMPFSAGTRNCIGSHFALLEARVILATLCSRVDWAVGEGYVHQPVMAVTLRPSKGLPLRFSEI